MLLRQETDGHGPSPPSLLPPSLVPGRRVILTTGAVCRVRLFLFRDASLPPGALERRPSSRTSSLTTQRLGLGVPPHQTIPGPTGCSCVSTFNSPVALHMPPHLSAPMHVETSLNQRGPLSSLPLPSHLAASTWVSSRHHGLQEPKQSLSLLSSTPNPHHPVLPDSGSGTTTHPGAQITKQRAALPGSLTLPPADIHSVCKVVAPSRTCLVSPPPSPPPTAELVREDHSNDSPHLSSAPLLQAGGILFTPQRATRSCHSPFLKIRFI